MLGFLAGVLASLASGLAVAALRAPSWSYLAALVLGGAGAVHVIAVRAGRGRAGQRTVAAVSVFLALLVAAPRLAATDHEPDAGPERLRTPDGHFLVYERLGSEDGDVLPVLFLHGGPGVSTRTQDARWLQTLGRSRPVVVYDQLGAGGSSRLSDPTGYSLERARQDLEHLRLELNLDRVVLVGHSWGAVVAASYTAWRPDRVEALVALAPGTLDPEAMVIDDPSVRLAGSQRLRLLGLLLRPRELYTYALARAEPAVAHRVAGDAEMDRRYDAILRATWPAMFCDPQLADGLPSPRGGFYANLLTQRDRAEVEQLAGLREPPPTLVLKPQCDYLPWSTVEDFVEWFGASVVHVRNAGHAVHLEQPEQVTAAVEELLEGNDPSGALDWPIRAPPSYRGPS
jgi:pimeloyl-ACP methyl ester carboxylesterase